MRTGCMLNISSCAQLIQEDNCVLKRQIDSINGAMGATTLPIQTALFGRLDARLQGKKSCVTRLPRVIRDVIGPVLCVPDP